MRDPSESPLMMGLRLRGMCIAAQVAAGGEAEKLTYEKWLTAEEQRSVQQVLGNDWRTQSLAKIQDAATRGWVRDQDRLSQKPHKGRGKARTDRSDDENASEHSETDNDDSMGRRPSAKRRAKGKRSADPKLEREIAQQNKRIASLERLLERSTKAAAATAAPLIVTRATTATARRVPIGPVTIAR